MIRDSEQHAETDKKKREMVECKNNAETQAVTAERQLTEWKYVTDAEKENVRKLLAELRTAMNNPNSTKDDIQGPTDKLQKAVMECGRTEYQASRCAQHERVWLSAAAAATGQARGAKGQTRGAKEETENTSVFRKIPRGKVCARLFYFPPSCTLSLAQKLFHSLNCPF